MIKEWQRGLGLQVVEDNVKTPNPNFLQHLREAINNEKNNPKRRDGRLLRRMWSGKNS